MQHFMNIDKKKFKNFIWRLNHDNTMAHGHKVMYKNEEQNFNAEFSIYNEKYKQGILKEHLAKTILPFYATWMLILLKFFHYTIPLLEYKTFSYLKKKILTLGIGLPDDQFIVLDSK